MQLSDFLTAVMAGQQSVDQGQSAAPPPAIPPPAQQVAQQMMQQIAQQISRRGGPQQGHYSPGMGQSGQQALSPWLVPTIAPQPAATDSWGESSPWRGGGQGLPPSFGFGAQSGAGIAGMLGQPVPGRGPVFNPNVALDPSQVDDRRGQLPRLYADPGPMPVLPPIYQPWAWHDYQSRLQQWQRDYDNWRRSPSGGR